MCVFLVVLQMIIMYRDWGWETRPKNYEHFCQRKNVEQFDKKVQPSSSGYELVEYLAVSTNSNTIKKTRVYKVVQLEFMLTSIVVLLEKLQDI